MPKLLSTCHSCDVCLAQHGVRSRTLARGVGDQLRSQARGQFTVATLEGSLVLHEQRELLLVDGTVHVVDAEAEGVHEHGRGQRTGVAITLGGGEVARRSDALVAHVEEPVAHLDGEIHAALVHVLHAGVAATTFGLMFFGTADRDDASHDDEQQEASRPRFDTIPDHLRLSPLLWHGCHSIERVYSKHTR